MEPEDWKLTERVWASARSGKGDPFAAAVRATRMAMIITDPRRLDNPIVFANDAFLHLTGYTRLEVTGRNCRFLQGPETDIDAVACIREAVAAERDVKAELLNYRKDGSTFHNEVYISPVHDEAGRLLFYFASQLDVSERHALAQERDRTQAALDTNSLLLREVGHRARNDLQMIAAMLTLQSGNSGDPAVRAALGEAIGRIEALGALYREPEQGGAGHDLGDLVSAISDTRVAASGHEAVALAFDLAPLRIWPDAAAPLALILNEVLSAVLKHAAPGRALRLTLRVARENEAVLVELTEEGGGGRLETDAFATTLVDALTRQIGGTRGRRERDPAGSVLTLRFQAGRVAA